MRSSIPSPFVPCDARPLDALRALIAESRIPSAEDDLPPMAAGVFGYLGYDMVREMERLAPAKPDPIGVPDSIFMRPTIMVVFDTVRDENFHRDPGSSAPKSIGGTGLCRGRKRASPGS